VDRRGQRVDDGAVSTEEEGKMGDKSPKAKEKAKKQNTADKNQRKAAAAAKASAATPPKPAK